VIQGLGVDTVEIERIGRVMTRWPGFLERVLTDREKVEVAHAVHRVAARWAAKEAFFKALDLPAKGLVLSWREVEVRNTLTGRPFFNLSGKIESLVRRRGWRLHLSLSHDRERAIAIVLVEKIPRSRKGIAWGYKPKRRSGSWN